MYVPAQFKLHQETCEFLGLGTGTLKRVQAMPQSFVVKDLVGVLQNCIDNLDLPSGVGDASCRIGTHDRGAKDDGEVVGVHPVDMGVLHDAVEVEGQRAQSGVVGIGEAVDDGVEGVSANNVIFLFYEGLVIVKSNQGRATYWLPRSIRCDAL